MKHLKYFAACCDFLFINNLGMFAAASEFEGRNDGDCFGFTDAFVLLQVVDG